MQAIGTTDVPWGVGYTKITAGDSELHFNCPFDPLGEISIDGETYKVDHKLHVALRDFFRKVVESEQKSLIDHGRGEYDRGMENGKRVGIIMCEEHIGKLLQSTKGMK